MNYKAKYNSSSNCNELDKVCVSLAMVYTGKDGNIPYVYMEIFVPVLFSHLSPLMHVAVWIYDWANSKQFLLTSIDCVLLS